MLYLGLHCLFRMYIVNGYDRMIKVKMLLAMLYLTKTIT